MLPWDMGIMSWKLKQNLIWLTDLEERWCHWYFFSYFRLPFGEEACKLGLFQIWCQHESLREYKQIKVICTNNVVLSQMWRLNLRQTKTFYWRKTSIGIRLEPTVEYLSCILLFCKQCFSSNSMSMHSFTINA